MAYVDHTDGKNVETTPFTVPHSGAINFLSEQELAAALFLTIVFDMQISVTRQLCLTAIATSE